MAIITQHDMFNQRISSIITLTILTFLLAIITITIVVFNSEKIIAVDEPKFYCGVVDDNSYESNSLMLHEIKDLKGYHFWYNDCIACHSFTKEVVVGPALYGSTRRLKKSFFKNLVMSSKKLKTDKYYKKLANTFGDMSYHSELYPKNYTDKSVDSLWAFLDVTTKLIDRKN